MSETETPEMVQQYLSAEPTITEILNNRFCTNRLQDISRLVDEWQLKWEQLALQKRGS